MLYKHRKIFDKIANSLGSILSRIPLHPNHWTFISIILSVASGYFLIKYDFFMAALFFAIMSLSDIIDGAVARFRSIESPLGAFYDTITDRYVEFIIIISLFLSPLVSVFIEIKIWIILFLFGSMMTTYSRASARRDLGVEIKGGLLERSERLIILFIGIVLAMYNPIYLSYTIAMLAVLTNVSALQRIVSAIRSVKR